MDWNGTKDQGLTREQLEESNQIGIKDPTGLYGFAGYFAKKFVARPEDNEKGWYGFKNLTIFRYAEVLLMYAEACAQTNDPDGLQYLKEIQERAGSDHIYHNAGKTKKLRNVARGRFLIWYAGVILMVL